MPDELTYKKIPDVKKLLEYKTKAHCELCDIKKLDCCGTCLYTAIKQFIDLFDRLQKNKEYYKKSRDDCLDKVMFIAKQCDELEAEKQSLKAEIERLKDEYEETKKRNQDLEYAFQSYKAEAYKEFAERLKELPYIPNRLNLHKDYDNLLKELVGDDNESKD